MVDVIIKGFKSNKEAKEFYSWFEGQGEQDLYVWFIENKIIPVPMTDMEIKPEISENTLTFWVK